MKTQNLGKWYRDGETIVHRGDEGSSMFVVLSGELHVFGEHNGTEVKIGALGAGDIFGEMALFEKEVRSATVRAHGDAMVMTLDKRTLLRRIKEDPLIALNLLETLCRRTRHLNDELAQLRAQQPGSEGVE